VVLHQDGGSVSKAVQAVRDRIAVLDEELNLQQNLRAVANPNLDTMTELFSFLQIKVSTERLTVGSLQVARKLGEAWLKQFRPGMSETERATMLNRCHLGLIDTTPLDRKLAEKLGGGRGASLLEAGRPEVRVETLNMVRQGVRPGAPIPAWLVWSYVGLNCLVGMWASRRPKVLIPFALGSSALGFALEAVNRWCRKGTPVIPSS
jgi:hypothetical protein